MWNGTEAQRQALKAHVLATPALASLTKPVDITTTGGVQTNGNSESP